jgi:hypothetical protein
MIALTRSPSHCRAHLQTECANNIARGPGAWRMADQGEGVAVLANGSANGSYAAKALANIGRPGPEPEKGSKGFGQDRQLRLDTHYSV